MGQVYGVPDLHPGFSRFAYLPREAIESVWTSYNLLGEGWSLDIESMKNIFNNASYLVNDIGNNKPLPFYYFYFNNFIIKLLLQDSPTIN